MATDKVKVLYIAGNGRSGSTLLGVVLGNVPGWFNVGEVRRVFDAYNSRYDIARDSQRMCSCGAPFEACPAWTAIFARAFGELDPALRHRLSVASWKFSAHKRLAAPGMGEVAFPWEREEFEELLAALHAMYGAIPPVTGARVIVDASKWPLYGAMVGQLPNVELYVLHLIRDPRAIAHSWTKNKYIPGQMHVPRQNVIKATSYWVAVNPAVERFWGSDPAARYMRMSYEAFVRDPRPHLERIAAFVGEPDVALPLLDDHTVQVEATHSVAGNESREARGALRLRLDDAWRERLPWYHKASVEAMTWPMLRRYGYAGGETGRALGA